MGFVETMPDLSKAHHNKRTAMGSANLGKKGGEKIISKQNQHMIFL